MKRLLEAIKNLLFFWRRKSSAANPVAPLLQDDKAIVIRIDDKPEAEKIPEAMPVPTFTAHHHHF